MKLDVKLETHVILIPVVADGTNSPQMVGQAGVMVVAGDFRIDKALSHDRVGTSAHLVFVMQRPIFEHDFGRGPGKAHTLCSPRIASPIGNDPTCGMADKLPISARSAVHVIPSGFDPERFPWPWPSQSVSAHRKLQILFAGVLNEYMKGFHVLQEACARLWQKRRDFELVATGDSAGQLDPVTRLIGWQSQAELPQRIREADVLIFPTIAEEALGRTAVEAMGVGRPVIASRIGGLPFTVADGLTGLLFEPGNVGELAAKIELLLDSPGLREQMGSAGRKRFEERHLWPTIVEKEYRRLLRPLRK
jgi:glycosyltransferase involved in cell wall biosynthesis